MRSLSIQTYFFLQIATRIKIWSEIYFIFGNNEKEILRFGVVTFFFVCNSSLYTIIILLQYSFKKFVQLRCNNL